MEICPKCGRYMLGHIEMFFGDARMVWMCPCGYSSKKTETGMIRNNRIENIGGNTWNRIIFRE